MFFWMMLASLRGIVMFGNLYEKTKPQENFIAPVYQAMALNMYQQHVSAEYGYLDAMRGDTENSNNYFASAEDGIVPLATVQNEQISGGKDDNTVFDFIRARLPATYKPQNGTRTYLFCVDKDQQTAVRCNDPADDSVKYIVTVRAIPPRYDGADKMTALRAVSDATGNSRFVGMLQKAVGPLQQTASADGTVVTQHQPLGAAYYVLSSGVAPVSSVYVPNYITCNLPLNNEGGKVLGDELQNRSYIVAVSLVAGLDPGENLTAGPLGDCSAVAFDAGS